MLIVTRRKSESIIINGNIEVIIVDVQGDKARIGIDAPPNVKIIRRELLETEAFNKEAANSSTTAEIKKLNTLFKNSDKNNPL